VRDEPGHEEPLQQGEGMMVNMDITRRSLVRSGIGASALAAAGRPARAQRAAGLVLAVWAGSAEQDAYNRIIAKYQALNPGTTIRLEIVPYGQYYQQLDTRLAGRQAPDMIRMEYWQLGRYARDRAILPLDPYLGSDAAADFDPKFWAVSGFQGKQYILPHHTDTFALFYNVQYMRKIGVEPPRSLDQAWSWEDFIKVARMLKDQGVAQYPFAVAWQPALGYRWMMFLYQNGGRLLSEDLRSPAINSREAVETVAWTQSFFKEGLVPSPSISLADIPRALAAAGLGA